MPAKLANGQTESPHASCLRSRHGLYRLPWSGRFARVVSGPATASTGSPGLTARGSAKGRATASPSSPPVLLLPTTARIRRRTGGGLLVLPRDDRRNSCARGSTGGSSFRALGHSTSRATRWLGSQCSHDKSVLRSSTFLASGRGSQIWEETSSAGTCGLKSLMSLSPVS